MPATSMMERSKAGPEELAAELASHAFNPCVGSVLVSEAAGKRVWTIHLKPGERLPFHRHVLNYFWTAVTAGRAVSHINGGEAVVNDYQAGDTRHLTFRRGEFMIHDLENVGDTDMVFVTVEFFESENQPLPLPHNVRRHRALSEG
jgi:quercetin dioxygenase-like cupin family protein